MIIYYIKNFLLCSGHVSRPLLYRSRIQWQILIEMHHRRWYAWRSNAASKYPNWHDNTTLRPRSSCAEFINKIFSNCPVTKNMRKWNRKRKRTRIEARSRRSSLHSRLHILVSCRVNGRALGLRYDGLRLHATPYRRHNWHCWHSSRLFVACVFSGSWNHRSERGAMFNLQIWTRIQILSNVIKIARKTVKFAEFEWQCEI